MSYFIRDTIGLILAFLNTLTVLLLLYFVLQLAGVRGSRVLEILDRIFSPALVPVRRLLRKLRFDISPLILAAVLQLIALGVKNWL